MLLFLISMVNTLSCSKLPFLSFSNPVIHQRAINVVRNLLFNHDLDIRYTNPDIKCRLAALYLPLVSIVIDALPQLYDPYTEGRQRNSNNFDEEGDKISQKLAMAIAGSTFFSRAAESVYDPSETAAKVGATEA